MKEIAQLCGVLLLAFLSTVTCDYKEIGFNQNFVRCASQKCDPELRCGERKKDTILVKNPGSCCPECVCAPCPELDLSVCTVGFKPYKQARGADECCDKIVCISKTNIDISSNILESTITHEDAIEDEEEATTTASISNIFSPSNVDKSILMDGSGEDVLLSVENNQDEDYDDYYLDSVDGKNSELKIRKNSNSHLFIKSKIFFKL
jgi:hypothetical protein